LKGGSPVHISKSTHPILQTSALASYSFISKISGAMYSGVPQGVWAIDASCKCFANPKSANLIVALGENSDNSKF
jgi:hypothetical protein